MTVIVKKSKAKKAKIYPTEGSMCRTHSKELEWALRDFISRSDGNYYDDELDKGILTSYFRLKNDICVEQKVKISDKDYVCYTTLSICVNPENRELFKEVCAYVNAINVEIKYGNFEVDIAKGDIRFRTEYEPDNKVYIESLNKLLGYPLDVINKYGEMFVEMIKYGKVSVKKS